MSKPVETYLYITKGQSKAYDLTFTTGDGTAQDITGATITFTVKRTLSDVDAVVTKTATITDATAGKATITLAPTDTDLDLGEYYYDIWLESSSIPALPIQRGKLVITWRVGE